MTRFITRLAKLTVVLGLILLALAGIFLSLGHSPENYVYNYQAETLANFAYGFFVIGFILSLFEVRHPRS